ncbi:MAG: MmgE/PrpD family protein [Niabella sp.]|nr:MmgE/PrpD family protein [Niabella sp.]
MKEQLQNNQIAEFALHASFDAIGAANVEQLKRHFLDALGSFFFSLDQEPIRKLVMQQRLLSEGGTCITPYGSTLPADRAAQLYTALIRYPDFMDNFMGKEATCHPSDNIGPLMAVSQLRKTSGKDFLTAMAVAYQLECRLVEEIPVMKEGIDHTLLLGYSMTAGIARLLGMTVEQTAHALGITGTSISPMVTSRASYTYEWKGLASSLDALNCVGIALLAQQGITGPVALFEGPKGFDEVFGMKLDYDWANESFDLIQKCVLKRYNAEVHAQASLEAADELRREHRFDCSDIVQIDITTFLTAYHIIGSGAYGNRKEVETKEQADHSLFYTTAALLLDGQLTPAQFAPARIVKQDVQQLLQKVQVRTGIPFHKPVMVAGLLDPYTAAYPDKMKTKVVIELENGETFSREKEDYHGFYTRPFNWEDTAKKFRLLTRNVLSEDQCNDVIGAVAVLEHFDFNEIIKLIDLKTGNE